MNVELSPECLPWARDAKEYRNIPLVSVFLRLLNRVGADKDFLYSSPLVVLPEGAGQILEPNNLRLLEFKKEYFDAVVSCGFPEESLEWCNDRIELDLPLRGFRGDCCYGWQKRDCNVPSAYILTWLYLRTAGLNDCLSRHYEDGLFGAYSVEYDGRKISRDIIDSVLEIFFMKKMLTGLHGSSPVSVLDIGAGYGRLAHRLFEEGNFGQVICTDGIPESSFICDYYLKFRGVDSKASVCTPLNLSEQLKRSRPSVAVNIHTFSTCSWRSVKWWMEILAENLIQHLFIVPNAGEDVGKTLLTTESDGQRVDYSPILSDAGYELISCVPKYGIPEVQRFGVSPTHYYWFSRSKA